MIEDMAWAARLERRALIARAPKSNPNGTTPNKMGASSRTPLQNSCLRVFAIIKYLNLPAKFVLLYLSLRSEDRVSLKERNGGVGRTLPVQYPFSDPSGLFPGKYPP
jgi:hypothetical protein